jgi:hypothetical protein
LLSGSLPCLGNGNRSVFADSNRVGICRNRDLRLERIAIGGHKDAFGVLMERPVTCVSQFTAWQAYLKEAFALDDEIQGIAGLTEVALGVDAICGNRLGSRPS